MSLVCPLFDNEQHHQIQFDGTKLLFDDIQEVLILGCRHCVSIRVTPQLIVHFGSLVAFFFFFTFFVKFIIPASYGNTFDSSNFNVVCLGFLLIKQPICSHLQSRSRFRVDNFVLFIFRSCQPNSSNFLFIRM